MSLKTFLLPSLLLLSFSCSKDKEHVYYNGEVVSQPTCCKSSTGFPFIIRYTDKNDRIDSSVTATLPIPYKIPGEKIRFEMRDWNDKDEPLLCLGFCDIIIPKQVVTYNVTKQ